jgi:hypothetical protein
MIQISADTRRAVVTNKELLTVGSAGIQVQFTLSEDWDALSKLAVFRVGDDGTKVDVVLGESLNCVVPPEVLIQEDEVLFIGIYGANEQGTIIIPTIWASAGVVKPGTVPNTPANAQPTPEIWAQILGVAQDAEQTAGDAMSMVEAGLASLAEMEEGVEDAETVRAANELTRISNEESREVAETARATAETGRANSETSRAAAEAGRVWKNNNFLVNGVSVTTLTPATPATASLETTTDSITGETAVTRLLLGIPQGAKGDQGDPGETLVSSVNEKTGAVVLDASDVGAYEKPETGIPATDLASAVQTSLGKADSAYQKPAGGIPATDLASAVQTSLGKADSALQTAPVSSVAGKTGAVTLAAGDVSFDDSTTYASGTVGAELSSQLNAIDQKETKTTYTTLSGTTVTQTGEDHVMYLCGELATLSFTAPASGITAIRFTSGTTATVVTLTGITMPDDWTGAEANKTYEINVLDGKGVYASWS